MIDEMTQTPIEPLLPYPQSPSKPKPKVKSEGTSFFVSSQPPKSTPKAQRNSPARSYIPTPTARKAVRMDIPKPAPNKTKDLIDVARTTKWNEWETCFTSSDDDIADAEDDSKEESSETRVSEFAGKESAMWLDPLTARRVVESSAQKFDYGSSKPES
jgi:hypothetical protein